MLREIFSLLIIGVALSMDTFSLSLGIGTFNISYKKAFILALVVGIMHFFMPILGQVIGLQLMKILEINSDILLGIILIAIGIEMLVDLINGKEDKFNFSLLGIFLFALGVSLDSFSVGLGLKAICNNIFLAVLIFSLCSFFFTFLGVLIGKWASKIWGIYASILGVVLLIGLGIIHLI